jgi:large subunit ribosomal protein L13
MINKTFAPSSKSLSRDWHLFDAKGQILGRLCTQIAKVLMGKDRTDFARNMDMGDHVVVINAAEVAVTGRKELQKLYHRHSGYPGGMKVLTLEQQRARKPEDIIVHAISGMLPHNKLHAKMLTHLHVFPGSEHTYTSQFKKEK